MTVLPVTSESTALSPTVAPPVAVPAAATGQGVGGKKSYLVGLDALRAVAAISVCLFHFTGGMLPKLVVPAVRSVFSSGYLGVDIFFVISGFIIPYSLVGKNHQIAGIFSYLKKRVLRINPPAYASIVLVLGQWFLIDKIIQHNNHYTGNLSWGQLINNLLFTIPFTNYKWISGIFWTLAIEFQFYLFVGILFSLLFERSVAWFIGLYVLVAAVSFLPHTESIGFLHYSSLFALGGIALLWQQQRIPLWGYVAGLLVFGGLIFWQLELASALVGIGTAVAINAIKVRIPGLSFLGKISYSFYLMHGLIGTTAEFALIKLLPPTTDARKMLLTGVCFVLAMVGSYVFYRVIEQPFMRMAAQNRR
ncbi:peptidoglycan/LPS O-acetylase OafA/YrhL [Hymenobacter sp. UYAg731]